jgi:DNA primase
VAQGKYPTDEIRERSNLVDIVSQHVALKKSGSQLKGLCPFHNEKTPSFQVNPDKGIWKCFGCGEGGDVFSFVQKIENLTFPETVELLARKAGITLETSEKESARLSQRDRLFRANSVAAEFYMNSLKSSKAAKDYMARRGVSDAAVAKFRIGYAPDSWDALRLHLERMKVAYADSVAAGLLVARDNSTGFYDRFRDRLMFPILDMSDRVIAFGGRIIGQGEPKYLNSPETPVFSKTKTLYGLNFARKVIPKQDVVIVVEGYMDALTAQEAGFENTVATLGTALTTEHVNLIARYTKNAALCYDADSAGMAAALKGAPLFEEAGLKVRIMMLPPGEDPDSILRKGDKSVFANHVAKAIPLIDYRLRLAVKPFDLKTPEGKTSALKAAVEIVAQVDSSVERERLIRMMAQLHPNFGSGTTRAEDHIRSDIERSRTHATRTVKNTAQPNSGGAADRPKKAALSLRDKTERLILGMLVCKKVDPNKVFAVCPAKEFLAGKNAILAQAIESLYASSGEADAASMYGLLDGGEAQELLTDLVVGTDESEYEQPLQELLNVLHIHKKNESLARKRELMQKVNDGVISRDDPEYEEYMKLVRETSSPFRR